MNYLIKVLLYILSILTFSFSVLAISTDWAESESSKVRIISPLTNNNNQTELILGLQYKMKPGWKTYWKSPGDGGFSQNLNWENSENIKNIEIKWPIPKTFEILGFNSIGYESEVVFPLLIKIEDINKISKLDLSINYLTCKDICIPGKARLFLDIPSGIGYPTDFLFDIEKALSLLPQKNIDFSVFEKVKITAFEFNDKIIINSEIESSTKFINPKIFIHTAFGLPVVDEKREYSMDYKKLLSSFHFNKNLINQEKFLIELILVDQKNSFTIQDTVILKKTNQLNFINNILLFYFFSAFLGGLILNCMPCVFPVLSIKLMTVLNSNIFSTRYRFIVTSLGIICSFFLLGLIFLILKQININISWGMQFQQPYFLMFIIFILSLFMLNLFGIFEFRLPNFFHSSKILNLGQNKYSKDFFTGFFATLLATPCSAPFVGTAITAAFTQPPLILISIFFFMGFGMSVPYLIIATFPKLISFLPKPGKWMNYTKYFLGILIFATIVWISNILFSYFNYYFFLISVFLFSLSIFVIKLKLHKYKFLVIFISIFFFLPTFNILQNNNKINNLDKDWIDFFSIELNELINDNKVVFIDITANWCATCQFNKLNVLNKNSTSNVFKKNNITLIRADWTKPDKRINNFLNNYNKFGIPFNAFFSIDYPEGIILSEILTENEIIETINIINSN
ncbi:MAG: hypothetical protein CMI96_03845 [Pelagibacteraceae bacterium]|nr:hypothetical protein [Pelagibacteraceae bacterium]